MKIVHFSELVTDVRDSMKGARWILLEQDDIKNALPALMFAELDGVLVAVDHRKSTPDDGLWQRAVHLMLVSEDIDSDELAKRSGITKVVADNNGSLEDHIW